MYLGPSIPQVKLALSLLKANPGDAQYARYLLNRNPGKHPILALQNCSVALHLRLHYGITWPEDAVKMALDIMDRTVTP